MHIYIIRGSETIENYCLSVQYKVVARQVFNYISSHFDFYLCWLFSVFNCLRITNEPPRGKTNNVVSEQV